jgi:hypothetical protein
MDAGVTAGSPVATAVADIEQASVLDRVAYPVTAAVSGSGRPAAQNSRAFPASTYWRSASISDVWRSD